MKYKCIDCSHIWETNEDAFECPECHNINFQEIGGNGIGSIMKKYWWLGVILLGLIFVIRCCSGCSDNEGIKVTTERENNRLIVKLEGKQNNEYSMVLRKDGVVYDKIEKKTKHTFSNLEGTYTLDITYIGKNTPPPKINKSHWEFTFEKPPKAPEITGIKKTPYELTKKVKVYTVTIKTNSSAVPLNETEFSKDGTNWQNSNVFNNVAPGNYTFYARNKNNISLTDERQCPLGPYTPTSLPTIPQLNTLLNKIADCDEKATDEMRSNLGNNLKVKGVSNINNVQELIIDAFCTNKYTVTNIELNSDGDVLSITVK
jgi:hypothetical protein